MEKSSTKKSAVISLLDHVYEQSLKAEPLSWQRINYAMQNALEIAIGALFEFTPGDWKHILSNYKSCFWIGDDVERWYSNAVASGNSSSFTDFESMRNRQPIIADNVDPVKSAYAHVTGSRVKERLHVGAKLQWQGHRVTVTSFKGDGSCTACAYAKRDGYDGKVIKRFTITREAIIGERADAKRRNEIQKAMEQQPEECQNKFLQLLGSPGKEQYSVISLKKIEKVFLEFSSKEQNKP